MKHHEPLISIVDDDESLREAVQALLESVGRHAVAFVSAEQFLASSAVGTADCLILDLRMPGMTGLELHLRMLAAGYRIPTIVLTAHANDMTRAEALVAGAAVVLPKPFQADILLEAVEASLRTPRDVSDEP